jgi:hypothetical protein
MDSRSYKFSQTLSCLLLPLRLIYLTDHLYLISIQLTVRDIGYVLVNGKVIELDRTLRWQLLLVIADQGKCGGEDVAVLEGLD